MVRKERLDTLLAKVCRTVLSLTGANGDVSKLEAGATLVEFIVAIATLKVAHY
jgi:hypothetical protein